MARSNLLTRLLLLVFVATLPAFAVLLDFQWQLRADRLDQAKHDALTQALLIHADMANTLDNVRKLMGVVTRHGRVQRLDAACAIGLGVIQPDLEGLSFAAVLDPAGKVVCSSGTLPDAADLADLAQSTVKQDGFNVGHYIAGQPALLGLGLPFTDEHGVTIGVVATGLGLDWLGAHVTALAPLVANTVTIGDRNGVVLARFPDHAQWVGHEFLAEGRRLLAAAAPGTTKVKGYEGRPRIVGYVPPADGIYVSAGFFVSDLTARPDRLAEQGYVVILIGFLVSMLLAWFVGQRFVRAPTAALLSAAQRWGSGDLSVRTATSSASRTEFGSLATAFNAMAGTLQAQQGELKLLNEALETRVRERTHALLESNNRLQVEIAERELTEADLRQAQKLQALGQLAGGIAHEFNNLLSAVLGSLELVRRHLTPSQSRQARLLDVALQSVHRGSRLTAQLLTFSRKQQMQTVSADLNTVIQDTSSLLETTLGKTVRIELRLDLALWNVMADTNQFEAALLNLALNARDAMPGGGRLTVLSSNVVIGANEAGVDLPAGEYVSVTVADSGTGMTEAVRSRAIEPFFTTKSIGQGSGLGLSQVHGMVRQLGGALRIVSRPRDGTRVTILLARVLAEPPVEMKSVFQPGQRPLGPDEAVLLIDDDADVREVTAAMLEEAGFDVVTAANGELGLTALGQEGERIKLVIADYAMPGLNGLEVLQAVQVRRPGLPVLIATGYADFGESVGDGMRPDLILRKPFRARDLLRHVEGALHGHSPVPHSPAGATIEAVS